MRRDYDVIIATDFRYSGGTTASIAQEVEVQARMGLRTALCHIHTPYLAPAPWSDRIRRLVAAGLAEVISPRQEAAARLMLLRHPRVFEQDGWSLAARADHTLLVTNHLPRDAAAPAPYYDVARVQDRLRAELGTSPPWAPIGPMVRDALRAAPTVPEMTERDWHNIIDAGGWARPGPRPRRTPGVIGRHSRDHATKWPETRADLLSAYPDTRKLQVRILGGTAVLESLLGRRPRRWQVYPFGSLPPDEFLHGLDVYVYFHHSGWREAFGRSVLEALAAGLPVVTHPYLERVFGDACVYAEPRDAGARVDELLANGRGTNQRGIDLVRERYDWQEHRRRLEPFLRAAPAPIARPAPRRRRVLFVSSNGGGLGHLNRLMAIARRLPEGIEPLFLTMSTGFAAVRTHGWWVDYLPTAQVARIAAPRWEEYLTARVAAAVRVFQPESLVFDGTFVYAGLEAALAQFPELYKVWSRRPMWRALDRARARRALEQVAAFDLVLEPGELAAEADQGATVGQRHLVAPVPPIILMDPDEILTRDAARAELGIAPGATALLLNLSTGRSERVEAVHRAVEALLARHPALEVFSAEPIFADKVIAAGGRVHRLETYPLARLLAAFDACVAAPGYNAYHELLAYGVPTLFIPKDTELDDQAGRARWAADAGAALFSAGDAAGVRAGLDRLLDPAVRADLHARMAALPRADGARRAAALIAARSEHHPDLRRDLLPHLPAIALRKARRNLAAAARRVRGTPADRCRARDRALAARRHAGAAARRRRGDAGPAGEPGHREGTGRRRDRCRRRAHRARRDGPLAAVRAAPRELGAGLVPGAPARGGGVLRAPGAVRGARVLAAAAHVRWRRHRGNDRLAGAARRRRQRARGAGAAPRR